MTKTCVFYNLRYPDKKYLKQKKKLDRLRHYYFNFIVCLISASSYPYNDLGANSTFKPPKSRFYEPDQFLKSFLRNLPKVNSTGSISTTLNVKWGACSRWSLSLYRPMRISGQITAKKTHLTLDSNVWCDRTNLPFAHIIADFWKPFKCIENDTRI